MEKVRASEELVLLEKLAEELMRPKPRLNLVENYMLETGLTYSSDPIECIDKVLRALKTKKRRKVLCPN